MAQDGAHGVHLGVAGGAVAALRMDRLQDGRRRRQAQPGAAVLLRDQHRQVARLRQRAHEPGGIGALGIQLAPVLAGELGTQAPHGVADLGIGYGGNLVVHDGSPPSLLTRHGARSLCNLTGPCILLRQLSVSPR